MKILDFIVNLFSNIGSSLVAQKNEPHIDHKRDSHGNLYWHVHDLSTNKSYTFGSERDVRVWLEERYNRY